MAEETGYDAIKRQLIVETIRKIQYSQEGFANVLWLNKVKTQDRFDGRFGGRFEVEVGVQ